jgi:hypothetical protein
MMMEDTVEGDGPLGIASPSILLVIEPFATYGGVVFADMRTADPGLTVL